MSDSSTETATSTQAGGQWSQAMGTGCGSGSCRDNTALAASTLSCHAVTPQLFLQQSRPNGRASGEQRKAQCPKYQRSRVNIRRGKTDLKAGLPGGLQGVLQGLAEEIVGDGRP